jgi:hypothetical protein
LPTKKSTQLNTKMIAFIRPVENEKRLRVEKRNIVIYIATYQNVFYDSLPVLFQRKLDGNMRLITRVFGADRRRERLDALEQRSREVLDKSISCVNSS